MLFKKLNLRYGIQIALAVAISISLGYYFELNNPIATGVVTLATIQMTKRETLKIAFKRLIAFIAMIFMSMLIYNLIGFSVISYAIFIIIFTSINSYFNSSEVISSNIVMSAAFLVAKSTSWQVIKNEILVFIIGVGIGVIVNILAPVLSKDFSKKKNEIDEIHKKIYDILYDRFRGIYKIDDKKDSVSDEKNEILSKDDTDLSFYKNGRKIFEKIDDKISAYEHDKKVFDDLNDILNKSIIKLREHNGNMLLSEEDYYADYFEMRQRQLVILEDIWEKSKEIEYTLEESMIIADFLKEIRTQYHETNTNEKLLLMSEELLSFYREKDLPKTRLEFEIRAKLYHILNQIIYLLEIKYEFAKNLSLENRKKYWTGG